MQARLVAVALLALAAAGCGGGGSSASETRTFDEEGFGITFEYPGNFEVTNDVTFSAQAGASGTGDRAVALDDDNMLIVSKFALNISVTQANLAEVKPQVDRVFSQIGHEEASGKAITVGGLPGFEYTFPTSHPVDGMSRISILFDRKTEYELNCQSTPKKRAEVERACTHALATLRRKQPRS